jgi:hypothetical protein
MRLEIQEEGQLDIPLEYAKTIGAIGEIALRTMRAI